LEAFADNLRGFRQGLKKTGYVEGENVAFEYRWAHGQVDRLPELAADLVRRRVAVIATASPAASRPAGDEPPARIVIIGFFAAIGRPTPGLSPGLAGLTPSLAGRNRVGGTMRASATHWRAAHVNWFTRRGWRKRYSTDMREHVLLFCLLGLVLIAAI